MNANGNLSIDLDKLNEVSVIKSKKTGKTAVIVPVEANHIFLGKTKISLPAKIFINDELNQFDQNISLKLGPHKLEGKTFKEAKKEGNEKILEKFREMPYIGNGRYYTSENYSSNNEPIDENEIETVDNLDDLPF